MNNIGDEGYTALVNTLTNLNLAGNGIGPEGATILASALTNLGCKVTSLKLRYNNIGDEGVTALANALVSPGCKVTSLDLAGNGIGDKGAFALAKALINSECKITNLNLRYNNISPKGTSASANALENNITLREYYPETIKTKTIMERNKAIRKMVEKSVITLIAIGKFRKGEIMKNCPQIDFSRYGGVPSDIFRLLGKYLFATRNEVIWKKCQ